MNPLNNQTSMGNRFTNILSEGRNFTAVKTDRKSLPGMPHSSPYLSFYELSGVSPASRSFDRWRNSAEDVPCSRVILAASASPNPERGTDGYRHGTADSNLNRSLYGMDSSEKRPADPGPRRQSRFLRATESEPDVKDATEKAEPDPIMSCEDKMEKLKALLKRRKSRESTSSSIVVEKIIPRGADTTDCAFRCTNSSSVTSERLSNEKNSRSDKNNPPEVPIENPATARVPGVTDDLENSSSVPCDKLDVVSDDPPSVVELDTNKIRALTPPLNISISHQRRDSALQINQPSPDGTRPGENFVDMSPTISYEKEIEDSIDSIEKKSDRRSQRGKNKKSHQKNRKYISENKNIRIAEQYKKNRNMRLRRMRRNEKNIQNTTIPEDSQNENAPDPVTDVEIDPKKYNEKTHTKKSHKVRPNTPIYFCPETSKLFVKKKVHPKRNSKKVSDLWSVNTLIDKYVSFLKRVGGCKPTLPECGAVAGPADIKFDETKGKFCNGSDTESGDEAFTIVFSDQNRNRQSSECESEDSFVICFEGDCEANAARDCYTNDDVFDNSWTSEDEDSDAYSRSDADEDTTLVPVLKGILRKPGSRGCSPGKKGPPKTVSFTQAPPKVHKMIAWSFAYQQARISPWQNAARDAQRFKQRIIDLSVSLEWVLKREHRNRIFFQRFRPILMRHQREEREARVREAERLKREEEERSIQQRMIEEEKDSVPLNIEEFPRKETPSELIKVN